MATLEIKREIWSDNDGWRFDVGPDRDGLDCVEVRYVDETGKTGDRISFSPDVAVLVAKAMIDCAKELITKEER